MAVIGQASSFYTVETEADLAKLPAGVPVIVALVMKDKTAAPALFTMDGKTRQWVCAGRLVPPVGK